MLLFLRFSFILYPQVVVKSLKSCQLFKKKVKMNLSTHDSFRSVLKDYPNVMNIKQMRDVLGINTKTGYKL